MKRQFLAWSSHTKQSFRTSGMPPHQHHNEQWLAMLWQKQLWPKAVGCRQECPMLCARFMGKNLWRHWLISEMRQNHTRTNATCYYAHRLVGNLGGEEFVIRYEEGKKMTSREISQAWHYTTIISTLQGRFQVQGQPLLIQRDIARPCLKHRSFSN